EEIFNRTRIGVSRVSKGEQVPWIASSLTDEFYLGKASPAPQPRPGPVVRDDRNCDDSDMQRAWDFAERLGTKKAYEDFLDKCKTGALADRARDKIARLSEPSRPEPKPEPRPQPQPKSTKAEPKLPPRAEPRVDSCVEPKTAEALVDELTKQIEDNPNDPDNYFKRGIAHAQKSRYCLAVKDFDQTIRLNPKDPEAFNNRCWA